MRGADILIGVEIEDELGALTWHTFGGQRSATISEDSETIDITSKDSGGVYEYDYGLYGWTISCDGIYIAGEEGYNALKAAMKNKTKVKVRVSESGTATEEGEAIVTSRELEGPYDSEATYSLELTGTGKLEPVTV